MRLPTVETTRYQPPARYDREHLLDCAATLLGSGDSRLARNLYAYLLKNDPDDAPALRGLGLCLLAAGNVGSAKRCFRALPDDDDGERHFLVGRCYAAEGAYEQAVEQFRLVTRPERLATPVAAALLKEMGDALLKCGRWNDAAHCFDRAFLLVSDAVPLHLGYAYLEIRRGNLAAAETHYRRALALDPESRPARAGLGVVSHARGNGAGAARELYAALAVTAADRAALSPLLTLAEGRSDGPGRRSLTAALEQARRLLDHRR